MGCEERASAIHAGLHFIEDKKRAVPLTQCLRFFEVLAIRDPDSGLRLDRFHDESYYTVGVELLLQSIKIAEGNAVSSGEQRAKPLAPKRIIH
jgi:hypothetical protein